MNNVAFRLKYNINFKLEVRNTDELDENSEPIPLKENLPILMTISYHGKSLKLFTGYRIDSNKFNQDKKYQRVTDGCTNKRKETASEINNHLDRLNTAMLDCFDTFKLKKQIPSVAEIRGVFNEVQGKGSGKQKTTFFDIFKQYITEQGKESTWSVATFKKITTVYNNIFDFDNKLTFQSLDSNGLQDYVEYLRSKKNYRNPTIARELKFVRGFLKWAVKKGHSTNTSFQDYRPKFVGVARDNERIIFLTLEELKHLYNFDAEKDYLNRVKDVFLFCCFSGIRYSDAFNLTKADIKNNLISITTQKTKDALTIQLNKHTRAILDKYKDVQFEGDKVLPVISNQKMNKYLKELCKLAGFDEPQKIVYFIGNKRIEEVKPKYELIGTHSARRSFISNAIALGVPVDILIKWTGHRDFKALSVYLKILETKKSEEMAKFDF